MARRQAFLESNPLFKLDIQLCLSPFTEILQRRMARIPLWIRLLKSKDRSPKPQLPLTITSLTNSLSSPLSKGPSIRDLTEPMLSHLSCQKLKLLLLPIIHLDPFSHTLELFFTATQTLNLAPLLGIVLHWYFFFKLLPVLYCQNFPFSSIILQPKPNSSLQLPVGPVHLWLQVQ